MTRPTPGKLTTEGQTRDAARFEMNERVVQGVRFTLAKELRLAVNAGNTAAVAQLSRELLRTVDASQRLGDSVGPGGDADQGEPVVVISRDENGAPLEPAMYTKWYNSLLPPDRYERWHARRELPGAVEITLPWNGYESPA